MEKIKFISIINGEKIYKKTNKKWRKYIIWNGEKFLNGEK